MRHVWAGDGQGAVERRNAGLTLQCNSSRHITDPSTTMDSGWVRGSDQAMCHGSAERRTPDGEPAQGEAGNAIDAEI